jgi:hypothetical protein
VGGATVIKLYSSYGFHTDEVFTGGEWKEVEANDLHWLNNATVQISYHGLYAPYDCDGSRGVTVKCERALETVK